jgi:AraC family transcriptional regulator of adaptative response/methylated-DNA-[protein]-cysteine methyltransferase
MSRRPDPTRSTATETDETQRSLLVESALGQLLLSGSRQALYRVDLAAQVPPAERAPAAEAGHPLEDWAPLIVARAAGRLDQSLPPLQIVGTPFQCQAWLAMAAIPAGETRSYGALAAAVGHPGAARAIGQACADNPLPLAIPCHRVVAAGGHLGGFGWGLSIKQQLLAHERPAFLVTPFHAPSEFV